MNVELATGHLPSRPPAAPLPEPRADAWGDFLRRVLFVTNPAPEDDAAAAEAPLVDALPEAPLPARSGPGSTGLAAD